MHLKRQFVPKKWPIYRKGTKYIVRPNSDINTGLPILVVLRDLLKIVQNKKETKRITISLDPKRYGKYMTVIKGIDESKIDVKNLLKKLKSKLACGGTYKKGHIELQGSHVDAVKKILIQEGFPADIIET